jgi:hypothetical protein
LLQVSDAFQTAITSKTQYVKGRVSVSYEDPFMDSSVGITSNGEAETSYITQVANTKEKATHKWLSVGCVPDGTYYPCPSESEMLYNEMGYWSNAASGDDCVFAAPPIITLEFSARSISVMRIVGDNERAEYPVDFNLQFYNDDGVLISTDSITGNNSVAWEKSGYNLLLIAKVVLTITKWSQPNKRAKILEFFPQLIKTYEGNNLISINLDEEREFSTGTLPIGNIGSAEITIQLNNADRQFDINNASSDLYGLLGLNKRVQAWIGVELADGSFEYASLGIFFITKWQIPSNDVYAELTAQNKLSLMDNTTYAGPVYQNKALYDLALAVITDTGYDYYVDDELKNYTLPDAYFDGKSHRECLRIIAESCGGSCYIDRSDIIQIAGPSYLEQQTVVRQIFTRSTFFNNDSQENFDSLANYVVINTQPLTPATEAEDVYTSDDTQSIAAGSTLTISVEYSSKPVINATASLVDATYATIKSVNYYAWGADITVYSAKDDTYTIKVSGYSLKVSNSEQIIVQDQLSIRKYGKMEYDFETNPLIQTKAMAQAVATKTLLQSKNIRSDTTLTCLANPALELGDLIAIQDQYEESRFWIISQKLDFDNSGLSCEIKGKRMTEDNFTWNDLEELNDTWNQLDALNLTWNQLEVY